MAKGKVMTLQDVENLDREYLLADDVAPLMNMTPNYIRFQAQEDPEKLGFPVIVAGTRVRIPKAAFLYFCRYGKPIMQLMQTD